MTSNCVVHGRANLSRFHANVNELRRTGDISVSTLNKLPKRCCSCNNQRGESSFTVDDLRALCKTIEGAERKASLAAGEQPKAVLPRQRIYSVILQVPSHATRRQRGYLPGLFIGHNGANVQRLERRLNISMKVVTATSGRQLRKIAEDVQRQNMKWRYDDLIVLFTVKKDNESLGRIETAIKGEWDTLVGKLSRRTKTKILFEKESEAFPMELFEKDSRWRPKK